MAFGAKKQHKLFGGGGSKGTAFASPMAKGGRPPIMLLYVAIAAVILIIISYVFVSGGASSATYSLSSNQTVQLAFNKSVTLQLGGSAQPYALQLVSANGSAGYMFYFSRTPILSNPIYSFTIAKGGSINVSGSGASNADLQIKLLSGTNSVAIIELIPVPAAFGVRVSSGIKTLNVGAASSPVTTTINATTTANTVGAQSTSTTTVAAATTVSNAGSINAQVMAAANQSIYGQLMNNYKKLYQNGTTCTPIMYNSTYIKYRSTLPPGTPPTPSGQFTFVNVSGTVPYDVTYNISHVSGSVYDVVYSIISHSSYTSGHALSLNVNAQTGATVNATFMGQFSGASYDNLNSQYQTASAEGACGIFLP